MTQLTDLEVWMQEQLAQIEVAIQNRLNELVASDSVLIQLTTSKANLQNILKQSELLKQQQEK